MYIRSYLDGLQSRWAALFLCINLCLTLSAFTQAGTLVMGTANGPPYMIQESDSGLNVDIPREVLKRLGYDLRLRYASLARARMEVQARRIDLMAPMSMGGVDGVFMSDPFIYYRVVALSLKENGFNINNISDLKNYRVMTFQGARRYFGEEFSDATNGAPLYSEIYKMSLLPRLLYAGRAEVAVLDYYIFQHFSLLLEEQQGLPQVAVHNIFQRVPASVAFHDEKLRDQFNQGLEAIMHDGTYQRILGKYHFSNR